MPLSKKDLFIETLLQGPATGESADKYNQRVINAAFDVIEAKDIDAMSDSLADGIDVSIPIEISDPTVTDDTIANATEEHASEIEATKAANEALIKGIAMAVVAAATTMAGGTPAVAVFIPVAKELIEVLMKKE